MPEIPRPGKRQTQGYTIPRSSVNSTFTVSQKMSNNPEVRHPLLSYDRSTPETCFDESGEPKLSTLADHLGIDEIDAFHDYSSSRSSGGDRKTRKKGRESPTVFLTQEQVDNLIQTLENTGNALKQLTYRGTEYTPHRR